MSPPEVRTYDELLAEYALERGQEGYEPVRLGFGTIDAELRGISVGQVLGLAGRTATGKTFLLNSIVHNFAARGDAGSLALSLEMPGAEWLERQLAAYADVRPEEVEGWAKQGELAENAVGFLERMRNARVVEQSVSLAQLPAAIRQARSTLEVPLKLVLIDYLGLLGSTGKDVYERTSAVAKGLKEIAKEEKVAIVVATQVSRAGGDGSEPVTLAMLRDSGVIEEALDFLIGAWRPEKAANIAPEEYFAAKDVLRVEVLKNRKGPSGRRVDLRFRPDSRRLYEEADPFVEVA